MVLHRLSALGAAGATGSPEARIAEGLIADSDTKVIYAQSADLLGAVQEMLGLSATETELFLTLRTGEKLCVVRGCSYLVECRLLTMWAVGGGSLGVTKSARDSVEIGKAEGDPLELAVDEWGLFGEAGCPDPPLPAGKPAVARGADPLLGGHVSQDREEAVEEAVGVGVVATFEALIGEALLVCVDLLGLGVQDVEHLGLL
jgi:hypothetical protein